MTILYDIAISLLQEEPDAHLVLADCLEEQDDPWLGARARRMEARAADRVGIAMGVLPQFSAIRQGCNFIEHFLETQPEVYEYRSSVRETIKAIRDWTATVAAEGVPAGLMFPKVRLAAESDRHFYQPPLYGARSLAGRAYSCLLESFQTCLNSQKLKHLTTPQEMYRHHCGIRAELQQLVGHLHQESSIVMALPLLESRIEDGRENLMLLREIALAPCVKQTKWQVGRLIREFEKLSTASSRSLAWPK